FAFAATSHLSSTGTSRSKPPFGQMDWRGLAMRPTVGGTSHGGPAYRAERSAAGRRPFEPDPGHAGEGRQGDGARRRTLERGSAGRCVAKRPAFAALARLTTGWTTLPRRQRLPTS